MRRVTRWSPDTCNCVIEYEWDDAQDENVRTHTVKRITNRCSAHQPHEPMEAVFDTVVEENRRKNKVFTMAQGLVDELTPDNYLWFFDNDRVLNTAFTGLTVAHKAQLKESCDKALGKGKVKVI